MDKALNRAPRGLSLLPPNANGDDLTDDDLASDASIGEPGEDGSVVVILGGGEDPDDTGAEDADGEFGENLAEDMDDKDLSAIASDLMELVDADIASRKDWVEMYIKGLDVLGMKYEERTEPWEGACGVYSTILTEAAVRFQSETITETFPAAGPVKTEIIGDETPETKDAAQRVGDDMNFRLTEEMPEYRPEHERMLFALGLAGAAFKKVYKDDALGRQTSIFCAAEDVVIPYGCSSAQTSERLTHIMRKTKNEVKKLQVSGFYRDVDLGDPKTIHSEIDKKKAEDQGYSLTDDDRYQLYEIIVDYDLPGYEDEDGIALPYVITIDKSSEEILAIRRNWKEGDALKLKRQHFVQYTYIPGFGAYGLGLIHLIGGYARGGTSLIRQLIDAGTLSNLPGGLKSRGLRIKGDETPIAPGTFRDVDVPSGTVKDNIMMLPYKEPSQVLVGLLNQITDEGRRLGSIADMNISDMSANAPVGTTLALLERQLKTMSAVQARVHYSMKQEFKLLKDIIEDNMPDEYSYTPVRADSKAKKADYALVNVIPVSDPNNATMAQRIMQYQAVMQMATGAPQIYDLPYLHRQMIAVLGVKNAEKLVPMDDDMKPRDPVSENMSFLTGKPTKAFIYQDHDAHIAVHTTMMQDPLVMGQIGQTPQAQQIQASIMAHVAEHVAYQYRTKLQEQLGATLPEPDVELTPDVEVQLSKLVAQAATQLLTVNKGNAAQQQAQQQAQDPMVQAKMQEVQIKGQQAQTAAKKVDGELAIKQGELQLKQQELQNQPAQPTPEMLAQQHQQELQQTQQAHQQQLTQAQQQHQQALAQQAQKHQQEIAQAQNSHAQSLTQAAQGQQSESVKQAQQHALKQLQQAQKVTHAQEAHKQKLTHAEEAAKNAAKIAAKAKPAGDK
jgi:hypothetical protein